MKINHEKGFALVEILLIVLVVSVLGFGGYYVYTQNTKNDNDSTTRDSGLADTSISETVATESSDNKLPVTDAKTYSDKQITFLYPEEQVSVTKQDSESTDSVKGPTIYYFNQSNVSNDIDVGELESLRVEVISLTVFDTTDYSSPANGNFDVKNLTFSSPQNNSVETFQEDGVDYIFELSFGEGSAPEGTTVSNFLMYYLHRVIRGQHVGISGSVNTINDIDLDSNQVSKAIDAAKEVLKSRLLEILSTVELQ